MPDFGIGLYHYYADVAPTAAKMVRWLLALAGRRPDGRAARDGPRPSRAASCCSDEADYQLHLIYLWYEKQPEQALALLRGLALAHPRNPLFRRQAADVEDVYLSDHGASLPSWRALLDDAARARRVAEPERSPRCVPVSAWPVSSTPCHETDLALEHLRTVDRRASGRTIRRPMRSRNCVSARVWIGSASGARRLAAYAAPSTRFPRATR